MPKHAYIVGILIVLGFVVAAVWVRARLDCSPAWRSDTSADGIFRIDICAVPSLIAGPGQGSDGPGYAVLRDSHGWIAGVVHLETRLAINGPAEWTKTTASYKLSAQFDLPAHNRSLLARASEDALWRLRALLGLINNDSEFR